MRRTTQNAIEKRRFGSEQDIEVIYGINRRTSQKNRLFGRGFPFYRVGGRVLYDLDEVEAIVRANRVSPSGGGGRAA